MFEIRIGDRVVLSRHRSARCADRALWDAQQAHRGALVVQVDSRTGIVLTVSALAETGRPDPFARYRTGGSNRRS